MHLNLITKKPNLVILLSTIFALSMVGCSAEFSSKRRMDKTTGSEDGNPDGTKGGTEPSQPGEETPEEILPPEGTGLSLRGHVRFKKQSLLKNDIANTLELRADEICKEFDRLSCLDDVHHLAVGGVDPYEKSIFEGIEESQATTPIVIERTILSACSTRANRDVALGEGVVFAGLGRSPTAADLGKSITNLYRRALMRNPSDSEKDALTGLFAKVKEASASPSEDWAALACYAVLTSLEFVFY